MGVISLDAWAGSLWHKIAVIATPRNNPRHRVDSPNSVKIPVSLCLLLSQSDLFLLPAGNCGTTRTFLAFLCCLVMNIDIYRWTFQSLFFCTVRSSLLSSGVSDKERRNTKQNVKGGGRVSGLFLHKCSNFLLCLCAVSLPTPLFIS